MFRIRDPPDLEFFFRPLDPDPDPNKMFESGPGTEGRKIKQNYEKIRVDFIEINLKVRHISKIKNRHTT